MTIKFSVIRYQSSVLNRYKKVNFSSGTTLIELLIYIGLLAVFMAVLTGLFVTAIDIQLGSQATNGISFDANYILSRLTYDIQRAQSITTPAALGATSPTLTVRINNINYTYAADSNGNLVYTNNLGSFNLNSYSASVSAMMFTRVGNVGGAEATVKINMVVGSRVLQAKGAESQQISTTVTLHRNQ